MSFNSVMLEGINCLSSAAIYQVQASANRISGGESDFHPTVAARGTVARKILEQFTAPEVYFSSDAALRMCFLL
jgi:hypothetical protein